MSNWAYQAGVYKPRSEVAIALNDAGFVYGATVTDQCRTYGQQPFRLDDHLERFERSCQLCHITCPVSTEMLRGIIMEVLQRNLHPSDKLTEWSVVWLVTPGRVGSFMGEPGGILQAQPELVVYAFPIDASRFKHYYETGAEVLIARSVQSVPGINPAAKQRSRLHWWLAELEVKARSPLAQALLLDHAGYVTETASCNLALVRDGKVLSPRRSRILPGVSLQVLEELCSSLGIGFEEADLREVDLLSADEAILTSTPFGIAPVGRLESKVFPVPGVVFSRLWQAWAR